MIIIVYMKVIQNIKEISSRVTILGFSEIIFRKMLVNYCQFS
jgi:hypothetical protein